MVSLYQVFEAFNRLIGQKTYTLGLSCVQAMDTPARNPVQVIPTPKDVAKCPDR